jgi:hypothetical protein
MYRISYIITHYKCFKVRANDKYNKFTHFISYKHSNVAVLGFFGGIRFFSNVYFNEINLTSPIRKYNLFFSICINTNDIFIINIDILSAGYINTCI